MPQGNQREKLKQLFAKRVTTQARVVLEIFQKWNLHDETEESRLSDLAIATEKLSRFASRFEMEKQQLAAEHILALLGTFPDDKLPSEAQQTQLEKVMQELNECTLRKSDTEEDNTSQPRTFLRTPIYLALNDSDFAERIISQLEFFGFRSINFSSTEELILAAKNDKPETIVVDIDFGGKERQGIETIQEIQTSHETSIPIIYVSDNHDDIETRLLASRSGGEEFFYRTVDPGQLIEKIEQYTHAGPIEPYRVLVCDDSKAQAKHIENVLTKAGMVPRVIINPMEILIALEDFQPEIIIMDMYMPGCTGMELARVIRQQDKFHSVPIIYLSAEDDINKQLHAMSLGGDDFLTKPIDPKHLIATIHNRGRRARSLLALMIRDSLTGLYNHTHTLYLLDTEINKAKHKGQPLTFAMMDIDFFKKINDNYGHPIGDRVLKSLSLFLKQRFRKTDHIGRYGGEEFAIVLPNTSESDAKLILNEIRERFSRLPQPAGSDTFNVTFSCGIATSCGESAQSLCEKADQALYDAKRAGRNSVRSFKE